MVAAWHALITRAKELCPACPIAPALQESVAAKSWMAAKSIQLGEPGGCIEEVNALIMAFMASTAVYSRRLDTKLVLLASITACYVPPHDACAPGTHRAGTLAVVAAMSQTWLHPLLKKVLPAQGEVSGRRALRGRWVARRACEAGEGVAGKPPCQTSPRLIEKLLPHI